LADRIDQLLAHHEDRLTELLDAVETDAHLQLLASRDCQVIGAAWADAAVIDGPFQSAHGASGGRTLPNR
jgi:hypothetical protein